MYYYEIIYIVHPALQAGHFEDVINKVTERIKDLKGNILFFENWGKKKLAYLIQKQKFGTYIILQCQVSSDNIGELSNDFEHNTNIIRYLITKIDKTDLMDEKNVEPKEIVEPEKNVEPEENVEKQ